MPVLYLPAMQDVQVFVDCPVRVLYLPAMQSVHWLSKEAPTVADHLPAGHTVHVSVDCPVRVLYFPATHAVQAAFPSLTL